METRVIARINGVDILVSNVSEQLIPIKPICEALGVDYINQFKKIKKDEYFSSAMVLEYTTLSNGKTYKMCCMSKKYILEWILFINLKNMKIETKQLVKEYRNKCYDAIYEYHLNNILII